MLEPLPGDTIYDPTAGSGGMLVHSADYLREQGHHATSAQYFAQEMNWGNAAIGKINSVLHGLEATIAAGASTIADPAFKDGDCKVCKFSLVLANFPFSDDFWWLKPEQHPQRHGPLQTLPLGIRQGDGGGVRQLLGHHLAPDRSKPERPGIPSDPHRPGIIGPQERGLWPARQYIAEHRRDWRL